MEELEELLTNNDVEAFYVLSKLIDKNIISMNDIESVCEKADELTDKQRDCVHRLYIPYPASCKSCSDVFVLRFNVSL